MDPRETAEYEIDLRELFAVLRTHLRLIIVGTLAAGVLAYGISTWVIDPVYEREAQLMVIKQPQGEEVRQDDLLTDQRLVNTYRVILKSPAIMDVVVERHNLALTPEQLSELVSVRSVDDSQVIAITVRHGDIGEAAALANAVADTFREEIVHIMRVENVTLLSAARVPDAPSPVSPRPLLNTAIALVLGLMVTVMGAFVLAFLDQTLKTEMDVEQQLGLPVLGSITRLEPQDGQIKIAAVPLQAPELRPRREEIQ